MNLQNTFLAAGAAEDMLIIVGILAGALLLYFVVKLGIDAGKRVLTKVREANFTIFKNRNSASPHNEQEPLDELTAKNPTDFLPTT